MTYQLPHNIPDARSNQNITCTRFTILTGCRWPSTALQMWKLCLLISPCSLFNISLHHVWISIGHIKESYLVLCVYNDSWTWFVP